MKMTRKKLAACIAGAAAAVAAVVVAVSGGLGPAEETGGGVSHTVTEVSDVAGFLESFGWETGAEPCEVEDVIIPSEFNDVYQQYNVMQKEQGYDLEEYRGVCAKRVAYEIRNYPGQEENVRANVLVYEGRVIGGDVCSVEVDGFIQGFARPEKDA